jgi:hypothetical protein
MVSINNNAQNLFVFINLLSLQKEELLLALRPTHQNSIESFDVLCYNAMDTSRFLAGLSAYREPPVYPYIVIILTYIRVVPLLKVWVG